MELGEALKYAKPEEDKLEVVDVVKRPENASCQPESMQELIHHLWLENLTPERITILSCATCNKDVNGRRHLQKDCVSFNGTVLKQGFEDK